MEDYYFNLSSKLAVAVEKVSEKHAVSFLLHLTLLVNPCCACGNHVPVTWVWPKSIPVFITPSVYHIHTIFRTEGFAL